MRKLAHTALDLIIADSYDWNWYLQECCKQCQNQGKRISLYCYTRNPEYN